MGSKCSTIACNGIALPSRKADPISVTPTSTQKSSKRSSGHKAVIENSRSPEHPTGIQIKNRGGQGDTSDEALRGTNVTQLTEVNEFQYKKGPLIGKGTYGEVYECLRLNTGELLAVKSFKMGGDANKAASYIETLKKEIQLLRDLSHNNIVKYFTVHITNVPDNTSSVVDIILEYVSGGSVRLLLDKFSKLEEKVVAKYIRQVLDGLVFLHENGIIHRNIKGSNILIDTTGLIKLTDFGCSGRPDRFSEENPPESIKSPTFYRGPAYWSAPEVVMRKAQGKPADVWSVGCVVIEMLTGSPPWVDQVKTMNDFTRQIAFGTPPPFPNNISENCRDFLYKALKFKPEDRPSVDELLDHPFVKEKNQDSSYLEAESIQAEQDGKGSPERVLDLLNLDNQVHDKKAVDLKKNNFVQRYSTDEISINGLNIDAYASFNTGEFKANSMSTGPEPYSRFVSKERFDKDPNFMALTKKVSNSQRLRDASGGALNENEEEYSLYPEDVVNEMMTGVILKSKSHSNSSNPQKVQTATKEPSAESKEAIRRRIEEEMKRDLMLISGQLSDTTGYDENGFQSNENPFMPEESEEENAAQYRKRAAPIPIQNSFFTNDNPSKQADPNTVKGHGYNSTTQFLKHKNGERKQSLKIKSTGGIAINSAEDTGNKTNFDNMKKTVMESVNEEEDQEESSPQPKVTEAERKIIQEKLRKQYEEQMERSLARLNSDNVYTVYDKEDEPEGSMITSSKLSPEGKKHFEEDYSSQVIQISPTKLGSMCRIQGTGIEGEKEVSENRSGNWKGGWDSHGEDHDSSSKVMSSHVTESDSRSPIDKHSKKRLSEFSRLNIKEVTSASVKDENESFERVDNPEEVQEQEYEEIGSAGEEAEILQNEEKKLGIINEAEELKEDSLYDDELNARGGLRPKKV